MTSTSNARIVSLQICVGHREPMRGVGNAKLVAGFGIEGDRHATSEGVRTARQVLLMDTETLDSFGLEAGQVRENVTTAGIDLHSLSRGQRLSLGGDVVVEITGHCAPCTRMDEIRAGLRSEIDGHRGMLASVVEGGTVGVGDGVSVLEPAEAP